MADQITLGPDGFAYLNGQRLTNRRDPRIYGTAGNVAAGTGEARRDSFNPDYLTETRRMQDEGGGDAGFTQREVYDYALTPEAAARMGGRRQLEQMGLGGYQEMKDPNAIEWNDEFGFLTDPSNISNPDPFSGGNDWLPLALLAAGGGAMGAQAAGMFGGSAGSFGGIETGLSGTMNTGGNAFLADAAASGAAGAGMSPEGFYGTESGFSGAEAPAAFDPVPDQMELLKQPELTGSMVSDPLANPSLWDTLKPYLKPAASLASNLLGGKPSGGGSSGGLPSGSTTSMGGVATPPGTRTQDAPMGMVNYADIFKGEPEQGFAPVIQALMKRAKTNGGW